MHLHDLRHTGNMLAADAGTNLREAMERMGHSTTRAATVYLHSGTERQQAIADELSRQAAELLSRSKKKPSSTQRAAANPACSSGTPASAAVCTPAYSSPIAFR